MWGFGSLRAAARHQLRALAQKLTNDLAASRPIDFESVKKEINSLTAMAALRSPWERLIHAAAPVFLAVLVLSGAWFIRVPAPEVQVEATAGRVVLGLAEPDAGSPHQLTGFPTLKTLSAQKLEGMGADDPAFRRGATTSGTGGAEIEGGKITLNKIELGTTGVPPDVDARGPSLAVEKTGSLLLVGSIGLTMTARVVAEQSARVTTDFGGARIDARPPKVSLDLVGGSGSLVSLEPASEAAAIELPPLRPHSMSFAKRLYDRSGAQILVSTIQRGGVSFAGGARRREVPAGAVLTLGGLRGTARMRIEASAIQVTFTGQAGALGLAVAEGGEVRDLRPSLAEWLGTDRDAALVWSALVFLTGLALSVRRSIG